MWKLWLNRLVFVVGLSTTVGGLVFVASAYALLSQTEPLYLDDQSGLPEWQKRLKRAEDPAYRERYKNPRHDREAPRENLALAGVLGLATVAVVAALCSVAVVVLRKDRGFDADIEDTLRIPFVQASGTAGSFGVVGGALYLMMETLTSPPEAELQLDELWSFMAFFAIVGLLLFGFARLIAFGYRRFSRSAS